MKSTTPPGRVLIVLPRQLGDILLGTALPRIIKKTWPEARVSWYAHPMGRQLLERNPDLDEVFYIPRAPRKDYKDARTPWAWASLFLRFLKASLAQAWAELALVATLRARRFEVVIDVMNNPRTALLTWASRAPLRVSFSARFPRALAYNRIVPRAELDGDYLVRARLKLLAPLGVPLSGDPSECDTVLPGTPDEVSKVTRYFEEATARSGARTALLLSPTHRHPVRQWPGNSFVSFARAWIARRREPVIWLWGPGEDAFVAQLHAQLREALRLDGIDPEFSQMPPLFSLRETAVLSGLATGWVGNSNGLSHVAVAGGAPTVQLHGPTDPASWTHPDARRHAGLRRTTGCVGCEKNTCALERRECLLDLGVDEVLAAAERIFN